MRPDVGGVSLQQLIVHTASKSMQIRNIGGEVCWGGVMAFSKVISLFCREERASHTFILYPSCIMNKCLHLLLPFLCDHSEYGSSNHRGILPTVMDMRDVSLRLWHRGAARM